jgi:hypothetical protein
MFVIAATLINALFIAGIWFGFLVETTSSQDVEQPVAHGPVAANNPAPSEERYAPLVKRFVPPHFACVDMEQCDAYLGKIAEEASRVYAPRWYKLGSVGHFVDNPHPKHPRAGGIFSRSPHPSVYLECSLNKNGSVKNIRLKRPYCSCSAAQVDADYADLLNLLTFEVSDNESREVTSTAIASIKAAHFPPVPIPMNSSLLKFELELNSEYAEFGNGGIRDGGVYHSRGEYTQGICRLTCSRHKLANWEHSFNNFIFCW